MTNKIRVGILMLGFGILFSSVVFAQMGGHEHHGNGNMAPAGEMSISPERQQLIGVKIGIAEIQPLNKQIRTVGIVAYDPELYVAQNEYAQAVLAREGARGGDDPKILQNAEEVVAAAQLKLKRLGLSDDLIARIEKGDSSLIVGSDNGLVWIYGKIYENEIPLVKKGMMVHVTSKNFPGEMFMGDIASIDTVLDEMTRSVKVRAAVQNKEGLLKPNMYVNVLVESPLGKKLVVPKDAVMDTGDKQLVYVNTGEGKFEPRNVVVGQRSGEWVEIVRGLKPGEQIVTSGTFLIDSESKLKSTGGGHRH